MNPNAVAAVRYRPNRVQVVLATAWMILSLAIGGAVTAESRAEVTLPAGTSTTAQP